MISFAIRQPSFAKNIAHCAPLTAMLLLSVLLSSSAFAQNNKLPKLGELWFADPNLSKPWRDAFRQGLSELGYIEGRNIKIITLNARGDASRFPALLADLIAQNVDVMFVSPKAVQEAKRATKKIPIISAMGDPIAEGVAVGLARPGGNITGTSYQSPDISGKRLQIAMEMFPAMKRVALLYDSSDASVLLEVQGTRTAAATKGIGVRDFSVRNNHDLDATFAAIEKDKPPTLIVTDSPFITQNRERILRFAAEKKVPIITEGGDIAKDGALVAYGAHPYKGFKRLAYYVDRILKGAKRGDLPIEQPTEFELVINQKTAKALGIKIPESIMLRATEIIK
jgi:putative tryptophan/tyrosine transport system substrate-binding protein